MNLFRRIVNKVYPYFCNHCFRRYRRLEAFHEHYLICPVKERAIAEAREKRIADIAPVNRAQKRAMAKRAGQIKDWKKLNGDS